MTLIQEMYAMDKTMPSPAERIPALRRELDCATQALYRQFGGYQAPVVPLDACVACCMNADLEREMRRLPLRSLTARHFYEYNDAAKSTVQPADEIKYLAPRMLELLAQGAQLHHSTELYLDRLGRCGPGAFSPQESAALQRFALAFFALGLEQWHEPRASVFQGEEAFSCLLMWDYAGVPLDALLAHWMACGSESATLHFVDACFYEFLWGGHCISNAFATHRGGYRATMEQWLGLPATRRHWAERLMQLADRGPASTWLPAGMGDHPRYALDERIGSVFDAMAA